MKKTILKAAVATALIVPTMVMAEATLYGNVHVSINDFDTADNLDMTSNTSSVGVKGSEDLGNGMKAIYKIEFQVDVADNSGGGKALTQRDMWVGHKGGMGTLKLGIMSSNYKQMGGKVDALYRTNLEGRGFLHTQSNLHSGRGVNRGRQTNTVQYSSPKMGGIQLVANTTFSGNEDETTGVGVRWASKDIMVYADWIDGQANNSAVNDCGVATGANPTCVTESAMKVGGKYSADAFFIGGQYEAAEDRTGYDYIHVNGGFNINKNNAIVATYGTASHITNGDLDTTGIAVAYNHKMSKMTNVYVGYGDRSSDTAAAEDSVFTAGIKKKF